MNICLFKHCQTYVFFVSYTNKHYLMFRTEKRREVEEEQIPSQQAKKHLKRKIDA